MLRTSCQAGATPLHAAAVSGKEAAVRALMGSMEPDDGAIFMKDNSGATALSAALDADRPFCVVALLEVRRHHLQP